jgi:thioredoxin 1
MKLCSRLAALVLFVASTLLLTSTAYAQASPVADDNDLLPTPSAKKDLYPANVDAVKEIEGALKCASAEHKRVLLVFGGNWCYDCHVLDHALHEGAAGEIMKESFLLVHVHIGEANKNLDLTKKYNIPLEKGVPAVAILSGDGTLVYSSGSGEFEAARTMMRKDLVAFLKRWQETKAR